MLSVTLCRSTEAARGTLKSLSGAAAAFMRLGLMWMAASRQWQAF
jgi:hypothetical protein